MVLLRRTPVGDDGTPPHCAPDARRSVDGGRQRLPTPVSLAQLREWVAPAMGVHGSPRNGSERHERLEMGQNAVRVCAWAVAAVPLPRRIGAAANSATPAPSWTKSSERGVGYAVKYCTGVLLPQIALGSLDKGVESSS